MANQRASDPVWADEPSARPSVNPRMPKLTLARLGIPRIPTALGMPTARTLEDAPTQERRVTVTWTSSIRRPLRGAAVSPCAQS